MENTTNTPVTVQAVIMASVETVWKLWTNPSDIVQWNTASPDWHTPKAENDVRNGGTFNIRMEAKDGSFGFDFYGVYDTVIPNEKLQYTMGDGRKVTVDFVTQGAQTKIVETFDPEPQNPVEMQRSGWQAILDNFKKYAENH